MKSLLLLVLCCLAELALSKTDIYDVARECNWYNARNSDEALAYTGRISHMNTCELRFKLTNNQQDFTFRIENLVANNKEGVSVTILQYKSHHNSTTLWQNPQVHNVSNFSTKLNSTSDYEQKIVIKMLDHDDRHSTSVSVKLVVTPSYSSKFCSGVQSKPSYYLCNNTRECVHGNLRCDAFNNCGESEDEMSCSTTSTTSKLNVITTAWLKPRSSSGYMSTEVPALNTSAYTTSNSTVVFVFWWWHSWYVTSMFVISGILLVLLFLGVTICCVQSCCKKNKVTTAPTSTSINSRSTRVPESMQVSVIQTHSQNQSKPYSELPPAYSAVVASPPAYAQVSVYLDSPCGNSNPI